MNNHDFRHFIAPRVTLESWFLTPETHEALEAILASRHMIRLRDYKIAEGGISDAADAYLDRASPEILIVESTDDADIVIAQLDKLANSCSVGTKVILVGQVNDVKFYRRITDAGVSDYIFGPATAEDLIRSIAKIYEREGNAGKGKILAVIGASGGVGSSTVAQNLAWVLAEHQNQQTLLVDGDIAFGSSQLMFEESKGRDIADAFKVDAIDDAALSTLITSLTDNLEILSSSAILDKEVQYEPIKIERLLDTLKHSSPLTIIDLPHEWSLWVTHVLTAATDIVVVGAADLLGLRNTKSLMQRLIKLRDNLEHPFYVISNQGIAKRVEVSITDYQQAIGIGPAAVIPHDPKAFSTAMMAGKVLTQMDVAPSVTKIFNDLAQVVVRPEGAARQPTLKPSASGGIMNFIKGSGARPSERTTRDRSGPSDRQKPKAQIPFLGKFIRSR